MITEALRDHLSHTVSEVMDSPISFRSVSEVSGGCINQTLILESGSNRYFIKLNHSDLAHMFEVEAAGLAEIERTQTLRVPRPVCHGSFADQAYLVLEYLGLGQSGREGDEALATGLAAMHRITAKQYGWVMDNIIGATHQPNGQSTSWLAFWRDQRLGHQLQLAASQGYGGRLQQLGEQLMADLDRLLGGHHPSPSLLHGDLWGGNAAATVAGEPVVFDPAVYYGDREADLAMTELFGGFSRRFYDVYQSAYPLDSGYAVRKTLYNLYHILNHLNLFGGGYLSQAEEMIERLLAEVG